MPDLYMPIPWRVRQAEDGSERWEAVLIAPGISKSRPKFNWRPDVLRAAASLFEGCDICLYELKGGYYGHLSDAALPLKERLVQAKAGTARRVTFAEAGIVADIDFLPHYQWVPAALADNPEAFGLSVDVRVSAEEQRGDEPIEVTAIRSVSSVDIVTRPAAGGRFLRAVAGLDDEESNIMDKEALLKLIETARPELLEGKDRAAMGMDEVVELAQQAMTPAAPPADPDPGDTGGNDPGAAPGDIDARMNRALQDAVARVEQRAACARLLDRDLAASGLPDVAQTRVRERFEGQIFKADALAAAIKSERDYLAQMAAPGFESIPDQGRADVGIGQREKIQIAMDRLFGIDRPAAEEINGYRTIQGARVFQGIDPEQYDNVEPAGGIRELYTMLTGDGDVDGRIRTDRLSHEIRAMQADFSTSTFEVVLASTLNRRLAKDYRTPNYHESRIISARKPVRDFRNQEVVVLGYLTDLDTVAKGDPYTEFESVTDAKASYSVGKKGNILPFYREDIIDDDVSMLSRLVGRMGRAARRTHAKAVWAPYISNANCYDGTAWFTVGHGNLGSSALSYANAWTAWLALAGMTEPDTDEPIGMLDDPSVRPCLVYPTALTATAENITKREGYYSSNDLTSWTANPLAGRIEGVGMSFLSDSNDWGLLLPPSEVDIVEVGYLNGRQEPEVFLAEAPTIGSVFSNDQIKYKIRFEFGVGLIDYRGGYKAVVA